MFRPRFFSASVALLSFLILVYMILHKIFNVFTNEYMYVYKNGILKMNVLGCYQAAMLANKYLWAITIFMYRKRTKVA